MCTDFTCYLGQAIGPLINIFIVFIGWSVLYGNAQKIATRSETRGLLDRTIDKVRTLENEGKIYWLKSSKNLTSEERSIYTIRMQHELQILEEHLQLIARRNIVINLSQDLFKFRNSTTFCSEKPERSNELDRVLSISSRANTICNRLEDVFISKYKPTE